jgi:hypothetical protein
MNIFDGKKCLYATQQTPEEYVSELSLFYGYLFKTTKRVYFSELGTPYSVSLIEKIGYITTKAEQYKRNKT